MGQLTNENTKAMKKMFLMLTAAVLAVGFAACTDEKDDLASVDRQADTGTSSGWVDLGLTGGLLWAECSLGASMRATSK